MPFQLFARSGPRAGETFTLDEGGTLLIGRVAPCDILLDDASVSRRHCTIDCAGGACAVRDVGSANGTYVNGVRITAAVPVKPGDLITIGSTTIECAVPGREKAPIAASKDTTYRSIIRKQIEPGQLDWLERPAEGEIELLRRARRHLETVHRVSGLLARSDDVRSLFETIADVMLEVTNGDRAAVLLREERDGGISLVVSRSRHPATGAPFVVSRTIVRDVVDNGVSTLSLDAGHDDRFSGGESVIRQQIRSVVCVPLRTTDAIVGALYVDSQSTAGQFGEADLELLAAVGNQAGIAVHRARLLGEIERLFLDMVKAIAATIDAKDGYTHRHSERVAAFAERIAAELGLSRDEQHTVELSGLLHDVGKIGVPEAILNKPGRLTPEEFEEMKKHPEHGARILGNIQSARVQALLPGVKSHHEKWDGSGYPEGLRGEAIPLLGRLLAVADVLDALSSNRAYREALTIEQTLERLEEGAGQHFDPAVVRAAKTLHARGELAPADE